MTPPDDAATRLSDDRKTEIQAAYRHWLAGRGFRARKGQRQMIGMVARQMAAPGDRLCVVEAGTGTGKTAAYCLAVIPLALAEGKRVVIATATVALQEQVVLQDLPDLKRNAGLDFTWALAKGRGRYVCPRRLDESLSEDSSEQMPLFARPDSDARDVHRRMRNALADGTWDGEIDSWDEPVEAGAWSAATTDHRGCSNKRCRHFVKCPFFTARARSREADVVVANHDLVLADLALGGGAVLPEPEETFFVLDEAHHLPEKAQSHFTLDVRLDATSAWLEQMAGAVATMAQRFGRPPEVVTAATTLARDAELAGRLLAELRELARGLDYQSRDARREVCRFAHGAVPEPLAELAEPLGASFAGFAAALGGLHEALEEVMDGGRSWQGAEQTEEWLPVIGTLLRRVETAGALFRDYADGKGKKLMARWATRIAFDGGDDIELASAPLKPGDLLRDVLWEQCHGALATSATLCALGSFERYLERSGLDPSVAQVKIPSPFDFPNVVTFTVPRMAADPGDAAGHDAEVTARLPGLLAQEPSALVLFTSWRQFRAVTAALPADLRARCLLQGEGSRQRLLERHRAAIDGGGESYLFGLGSFTEGLDLPGDYCRHVILSKLPFQAPDDPLDEALAEWLADNGRNPFFEMSVPDASLRLLQACGRLIRSEDDSGRITLLDRRIVTRRYGQSLLDTLPPYRMELDAT